MHGAEPRKAKDAKRPVGIKRINKGPTLDQRKAQAAAYRTEMVAAVGLNPRQAKRMKEIIGRMSDLEKRREKMTPQNYETDRTKLRTAWQEFLTKKLTKEQRKAYADFNRRRRENQLAGQR